MAASEKSAAKKAPVKKAPAPVKKAPAKKAPAKKAPAKKAPPKQAAKQAPAKKPAKKTVAEKTAKAPAVAPVAAGAPGQVQFLADIIANPDDKKARLVYADLLQEAGDARGEFIAMQCARAELADGDPKIAEIDAITEALLKKHKKTWTAACGDNKGARYEYRRGFVEKLSLDAADLLNNADKIFAAEPIEELNVWKIDESKTKLGNSRLAPILALPLHRIRRLSLARCKLTADDFEALAAATTLGSVELLDLTNGGSYTIPVAPLAAATSLPKLRELKLGGCMMEDKGIVALAKSKTLRMQKLVLDRNEFGPKAGEAIANAEWAPGLVTLDLSSNEGLRDEGLRALAASTKLTSLKTLLLKYTGLYDQAIDIITRSPLFQQLDRLDVTANAVSVEDLRPVLGDRLG